MNASSEGGGRELDKQLRPRTYFEPLKTVIKKKEKSKSKKIPNEVTMELLHM